MLGFLAKITHDNLNNKAIFSSPSSIVPVTFLAYGLCCLFVCAEDGTTLHNEDRRGLIYLYQYHRVALEMPFSISVKGGKF